MIVCWGLWGTVDLFFLLAAEYNRGEGGQSASQRFWKHNICCLSGPGREKNIAVCRQVWSSCMHTHFYYICYLIVKPDKHKRLHFEGKQMCRKTLCTFLFTKPIWLCVSCRCDISVCYKPDSSTDWRLRRSQTSAQIQPLNPTFCSLLCLPIVTFSGALPWDCFCHSGWFLKENFCVI